MAKVRAHKITPDAITRDDLEGIVGVGTRNIGIVETTVKKALEDTPVSEIKRRDLTVRGQISEETATHIVEWLQENVDVEPRVVPTEEIFEEDENGEVQWEDTEGRAPGRPLLALAFDPAKAIQEAAVVLAENENGSSDLSDRLILVMGWLRGEFLAPAPEVEIEIPEEEQE